MKNIVLKKFVSRKLNTNITPKHNFGDIISEICKIESIAKNSSSLRKNTSLYIQKLCEDKKITMYNLWRSKKHVHLNSYQIFKLSELKDKLSAQEEFEITDTYTYTSISESL